MSGVAVIARYALREALRRRVLLVVALLTVGFLALFAFGSGKVFDNVGSGTGEGLGSLDQKGLAAATLVGLAMFTALFLGAVLAVFLTFGAIRGDAERGLLQPLVVRPIGRPALLAGRWLAASAVSAAYVALVYAACIVIVGLLSGRWPDRVVGAGLWLSSAAVVIVTLSLLGSVFLPGMANGIAVFMAFGAGLTGGLMRSIGDALGSHALDHIADGISYALPFEALYQAALGALTADVHGVAGIVVQLGPFGGSRDGSAGLVLFSLAWVLGAAALALWRFGRRDL